MDNIETKVVVIDGKGNIHTDLVMCTKDFVDPVNINRLYKDCTTYNMPYECEYKHRVPDPQRCKVLSIDFENRRLEVTNGVVRLSPSFDEVDIYKFVTVYHCEFYYEKVSF
jgi:hypothetical protein